MTHSVSSNVIPRRRRVLALAVTLAAAVASAASLDMAAPMVTYTASSPLQISVLTPAAPSLTSTVQVTAPSSPTSVELSVSADVLSVGDAGGGTPVVTASLGPDVAIEVDAGVPPDDAGVALAPGAGSGTLAVAAGQPCSTESCATAFTLTLSQAPPAQEIVVTWIAVATVTSAGDPPTITVTVTP